MPYWTHYDVASELTELCHELGNAIKQQLVYYRASVYKSETSSQIKSKIAELKAVVGLFSQDFLLEAFRDFEATQDSPVQGESMFPARVLTLLNELNTQLHGYLKSINYATKSRDLTKKVAQQKQKILRLCPQGSRQWNFFQSI